LYFRRNVIIAGIFLIPLIVNEYKRLKRRLEKIELKMKYLIFIFKYHSSSLEYVPLGKIEYFIYSIMETSFNVLYFKKS